MTVMGKQGMRQAAELSYHKAHYAAAQIDKLPGFELWNEGPFFNEFVVKVPKPVAKLNESLLAQKIIGGLDLGPWYPSLEGHMLLAVTERITRHQIDQLVQTLEAANHE
jgi:glycine dehydrogenase subunit 1